VPQSTDWAEREDLLFLVRLTLARAVATSGAGQRLRRPQLLLPSVAPPVPRDAVAPDADARQPHAAASGDDDAGQRRQLPQQLVAASDADVAAADDAAIPEAGSQCPR